MGDPYARDPSYRKPPQWGRLYTRHFPADTCGSSRHTALIAEYLRNPRSAPRRLLVDEGLEPDHWASSIEATVRSLWDAREQLRAIADGRMTPEQLRRKRDREASTLERRVAQVTAPGAGDAA
jgi:hypothetical protein